MGSHTTRRGFLGLSLATATMAAQAPRRFLIDSHQHYENKPDYFQRLAAAYRPQNAMACVNAFIEHLPKLTAAAKEYPDVVIPYGRVNADDPKALGQIERFAGEGAKGIKFHSPRLNWDDPHYFPLYAKLLEKKLTGLFHTGIASHSEGPQYTSMGRMRPAYLDTISRAFPDLYLQGAHLGNPWYEEAAEAARWSPRLYFDLTGSTMIKKAKNPGVFRDYLWWDGPALHSSPHAVYAFEKVVFGTDEPPENIEIVMGRHEAVFNACQVPEASRRKIYGETMAKILGIKPRA